MGKYRYFENFGKHRELRFAFLIKFISFSIFISFQQMLFPKMLSAFSSAQYLKTLNDLFKISSLYYLVFRGGLFIFI